MNISRARLRLAPLTFAAAIAISGVVAIPALADDFMSVSEPAHDGGNAVPLRTKDVRINATAVCAIVFRATIPGASTHVWYSNGWPHGYVLNWSVIADSVSAGPSVALSTVATQLVDATHTTYWLKVANYSSAPQTFEGRVCAL